MCNAGTAIVKEFSKEDLKEFGISDTAVIGNYSCRILHLPAGLKVGVIDKVRVKSQRWGIMVANGSDDVFPYYAFPIEEDKEERI